MREREYLTPKEVDPLQDAARKHSRYGHRDATAILIAYRRGCGIAHQLPHGTKISLAADAEAPGVGPPEMT